jgi:hypothetical protein
MIKIETLVTARMVIHTRDTSIQFTPAAGKRFGILLYPRDGAGCRAPRATLQELFSPRTKQGRHSLRELLYQVRRYAWTSMATLAPWRFRRSRCSAIGPPSRGPVSSPSLLRSAEARFLPGDRSSYSPEFAACYAQFHARTVTELCSAILREVEKSLRLPDFATAELVARACLVLERANRRAAFALACTIEARVSTPV